MKVEGWIMAKKKKCCESDGGRGITADGFGKNLFRREFGQLAQDGGSQIVVGDNPLAFR